jgi:hypothetical protein
MKAAIIDILQKGGSISIPHKYKINEWYGELKINKLNSGEYVIQPGWQKFSNIEDAANWFLNEGFTSKNYGYIQNRLMERGLVSDGDDLEKPNQKIKNLFKQEGELVDLEAKEFNIQVKPLPKVEDAINHIEWMFRIITPDNIISTLEEFEKEYMPLDPYINLSRVFEYERNGEIGQFRSSQDYKNFTLSDISYHKYNYKNSELSIKVRGNEEYFRKELNF